MGRKEPATVDLPGTLKEETKLAKLIDFGGKKPVWVPKSLIQFEFQGTKRVTYTLPEWWVEQNEEIE